MLNRLPLRARLGGAAPAAPTIVVAPPPTGAGGDAREEARRLLALLEAHPEGLGALGRSRELKAVAAEMIRRIEDGGAAAKAEAPTPAPRAAPTSIARLFTAPRPVEIAGQPAPVADRARSAAARLRDRIAAARPASARGPVPKRPVPVAAPVVVAAAAPVVVAAPAPAAPPRPAVAVPAEMAVAPETIRRLAREAAAGGALAAEHPAIIALALSCRPRREQAMALRGLPGPQARAVHRLMAP